MIIRFMFAIWVMVNGSRWQEQHGVLGFLDAYMYNGGMDGDSGAFVFWAAMHFRGSKKDMCYGQRRKRSRATIDIDSRLLGDTHGSCAT